MGSTSDTLAKIALVLGFVEIAAAIVVAYQNPVPGYELSIYLGTPLAFWVGISVALLLSLLVVFSPAIRPLRRLGALLGGIAITTVVSLPIIRGYHWIGEGDSLSHLGTAREMSTGMRALVDSRYPIVHTLGTILQDATGLPLRHVMLLVVVTFVVSFIVFVPLVVRELTGDLWATYVGLFSGFLLLPINQLSPSIYVHPTSQAIMFAPVVLFAFFLLFSHRTIRHSLMFVLFAAMYVLLHPQQAANLVAFFGAVALLQVGYDIYRGTRFDQMSQWVIPEVSMFAVLFWIWASSLPAFERNVNSVLATLRGQTQFAETTVTRSVSLSQVGGSLPDVFVKLFLVSLLYVILSGVLFIHVIRGVQRQKPGATGEKLAADGGTVQTVLVATFVGLVPLSLIFVIYLVGGISDQYFRHLGMLMVFATVLGAIEIARGARYISRRWSVAAGRRTTVLVLLVCLALSVPVVFASPYIYDSSDHVTEAQMRGYETTFEHDADSILFDEVRSAVYRYGHAIEGTSAHENAYYQNEPRGVPDHFANRSLRTHYSEQVYLPVTEADRIRDPTLWRGFRFSHADFAYLETEPGINRVQSNGGYDLYLVEPTDDPLNASSS